MSCADVMYQPYSPYFPVYQRSHQVSSTAASAGVTAAALAPAPVQPSSDYRKYCFAKPSTETDYSHSSIGSVPAECRLRCSATRGAESADCRDKEKAEAQYLSANCVVFTYYSGDISSVVDEHFSRALGQSGNYTTTEDTSQTKSSKDGPPMSHRNFPPSFWNSNYQSSVAGSSLSSVGSGSLSHISAAVAANHPDISTYGGDATYHHHHHSTAALLHHQNTADPWHYSFPSQTGHFGHHRAHDLSSYHHHHHSMPSVSGHASRFNSQYSSLLLQPTVRSAASRLGSAATCTGLDKSSESWGNARYDPIGHMESNYGTHYGGMTSMTGLETQPQESKDLYWF